MKDQNWKHTHTIIIISLHINISWWQLSHQLTSKLNCPLQNLDLLNCRISNKTRMVFRLFHRECCYPASFQFAEQRRMHTRTSPGKGGPVSTRFHGAGGSSGAGQTELPEWTCSRCRVQNFRNKPHCVSCDNMHPQVREAQKVQQRTKQQQQPQRAQRPQQQQPGASTTSACRRSTPPPPQAQQQSFPLWQQSVMSCCQRFSNLKKIFLVLCFYLASFCQIKYLLPNF